MADGGGPLFGEVLRRHRLAANLTQEELATRAQLSTLAISKLERGDRQRPYPHTVRLLAAALRLAGEDHAAFVRAARRPDDPPSPGASNVPAALTSLIGRDRELAAGTAILLDRPVRLFTLTGAPGSGKTRLALGLAEAVAPAFPDGVWFVPLASLERPELVAPTIAQTLGIRQLGRRTARDALKKELPDRRLLLVLDNFEHLLEASPLVAELLAAGPLVRILVTSRAPLRVSGEQQFPVPPLAMPRLGDRTRLEELARVASVELFVERARRVQPDFCLSAENAAAVAEICVRLDGLPLAIELAAARIGLLEPRELLALLGRRLSLLTDGPRNLPSRQRALRSAISWSYELLSTDEQRLFRQLGVFAGGCTLDAAQAIAGEADESGLDVLAGIGRLAECSLLRRSAQPGGVRVEMLESVRAYALEKLAFVGELSSVQRRHADYFVEVGERAANPRLDEPDGPVLLDQLERDHDNLRAALSWLRDQGESEAFVQLAGALWSFWEKRGYWKEGLSWLDDALGRAARPKQRARALLGAAVLRRGSDYSTAAALGSECVRIQRALGDEAKLATTLIILADLVALAGDAERAAVLAEEAVAIRARRCEPRGQAWALLVAGHLACYRADFAKASAHFRAALTLRRGQPPNELDGQLLHGLGVVLTGATLAPARGPNGVEEAMLLPTGPSSRLRSDEDALVAARRTLERALELFRARGEVRGTARTLLTLGDLLVHDGQADDGSRCLEESLALFREIGEDVGVAAVLLLLGKSLPEGLADEVGESSLQLWWRAHLGRELPSLHELMPTVPSA